jgi:hypothetical protein
MFPDWGVLRGITNVLQSEASYMLRTTAPKANPAGANAQQLIGGTDGK